MSGDQRYEALRFSSRQEALRSIASGEAQQTIASILGAAQESPDSDWVEAAAIALTLSNDRDVQRAGLLALSTLVRRFRSSVDRVSVLTILDRLDGDPKLASVLADIRDDLGIFDT